MYPESYSHPKPYNLLPMKGIDCLWSNPLCYGIIWLSAAHWRSTSFKRASLAGFPFARSPERIHLLSSWWDSFFPCSVGCQLSWIPFLPTALNFVRTPSSSLGFKMMWNEIGWATENREEGVVQFHWQTSGVKICPCFEGRSLGTSKYIIASSHVITLFYREFFQIGSSWCLDKREHFFLLTKYKGGEISLFKGVLFFYCVWERAF